jgi:hypothetical protein
VRGDLIAVGVLLEHLPARLLRGFGLLFRFGLRRFRSGLPALLALLIDIQMLFIGSLDGRVTVIDCVFVVQSNSGSHVSLEQVVHCGLRHDHALSLDNLSDRVANFFRTYFEFSGQKGPFWPKGKQGKAKHH